MFNNGKNIFIQAFTGLCDGFIKKTRRHKPQLFSTLFSGQDKNLLLLFYFWFSQCSSAYIATVTKLTLPEGASNAKQNPAGCRPIDRKLQRTFPLLQVTLSLCISSSKRYFSICNYVFLRKSWL